MCPDLFPQGFYWYGKKKHGPGRPSKRVKEKLTEIHAVLDRSLVNDDRHQTEIASNKTEATPAKTTSTETKAPGQPVDNNQPDNHPVDTSENSPSVTSDEQSQGPRVISQSQESKVTSW